MIKYILLALLIILILLIPVYCLVYVKEEDKIRGCRLPLIVALTLKALRQEDVLFINYRTFSSLWKEIEKSK